MIQSRHDVATCATKRPADGKLELPLLDAHRLAADRDPEHVADRRQQQDDAEEADRGERDVNRRRESRGGVARKKMPPRRTKPSQNETVQKAMTFAISTAVSRHALYSR